MNSFELLNAKEKELVKGQVKLKSTTVAFWLNLIGSFGVDLYVKNWLRAIIKVAFSVLTFGFGAVLLLIVGLFTYRKRVRKYNEELLNEKASTVLLTKELNK